MAEKAGIKSAMAALPLEALGLAPQRSMFGAGGLPAPPSSAPRRRGRPPGSKNKQTLLIEGRLTAKSGKALEELATLALSTPAEIARTWCIPRDLAARLKFEALKELAEYQGVKKRHLSLEGAEGLFQLAIFNGAGAIAPGADAPSSAALGPLAGLNPESEAKQEVIEAQPMPTDAPPTDAAEKGEAKQ